VNGAVNWPAVAACAAVCGAAGPFFLWAVRSTIREEIRKLNGTYVRSEESHITGAEIERRLERLETMKARAVH
jgi:hypothetical protein